MKNMPDELLIETYYKAMDLKLDSRFIYLLKQEIRRRSLFTKVQVSS